MSWTLHNFFIALHCCVQNLHLLHFRAKFACPCIPKPMFHIRVHRFLIIYQLPKSNCMIHRTQRPLFFFIALNILCFMVQKTIVSFAFTLSKATMSSALWLQILQCLLLSCFPRLQWLQSFMLSKTTMSFALCFQRLQCLLLYDFKDYNILSLLHFQRLQCLQSFMLLKTIMSSVI